MNYYHVTKADGKYIGIKSLSDRQKQGLEKLGWTVSPATKPKI